MCPILDAFMDAYPAVSVRLYLLDRSVNLIDEGIDVALRIAHLANSSLVATRVGEVRRVVAAAPRYLAQNPRIMEPADLTKHQIITFADLGINSWSFPPLDGSSVARIVHFTPRLIVNSIRGAIAPAISGRGVTRVLSYHIPEQVREGSLEIVLKDHEPPPFARASDCAPRTPLCSESACVCRSGSPSAPKPLRDRDPRYRVTSTKVIRPHHRPGRHQFSLSQLAQLFAARRCALQLAAAGGAIQPDSGASDPTPSPSRTQSPRERVSLD